MMNLNIYAANRGKKNKVFFLFIDLKREIEEDIVFKMKAETHILNTLLKRKLSN